MKYAEGLTQNAVEEHSRILELQEIKEVADQMESRRLPEVKSKAVAKKLAPAVIRSKKI